MRRGQYLGWKSIAQIALANTPTPKLYAQQLGEALALEYTNSFQTTHQHSIAFRMQLTLLDLATSILKHKQEHQRYPESLDEILESDAPKIPIDFGDEQPLRYRPRDDGFLLYSVGINGKDEQGQGDDLAIRLNR